MTVRCLVNKKIKSKGKVYRLSRFEVHGHEVDRENGAQAESEPPSDICMMLLMEFETDC